MAKTVDLNSLTLREKIHEAARKSRDMTEHLEQGFLPKVHALRKLTLPQDPAATTPPVADITIRHHAAEVLESEEYTDRLDSEAMQYFEAVSREVADLLKRKV